MHVYGKDLLSRYFDRLDEGRGSRAHVGLDDELKALKGDWIMVE